MLGERAKHFACKTRDEHEAKWAVKAAAAVSPTANGDDSSDDAAGDDADLLSKIAVACADDLSLDCERVCAALKALGYVALLAPQRFASVDAEVTVNFVVKALLMNNESPELEEPPADAPEWTQEPTTECRAKVLGIKLLVRRLLGKAAADDVSGDQLQAAAAPSVRILTALLEGMGNLRDDNITPLVDRSRLRLAAGCGLLKLAQDPRLRENIDNPLYRTLSTLVQDSCVEVRATFCRKLHRGLLCFRLPLSFMAMFVLSAIDPNDECRAHSAAYLHAVIKLWRKRAALVPKGERLCWRFWWLVAGGWWL